MKLVKIGDFLKRSKIPVEIQDDEDYKRVTIRINHNGVSLRDIEKGKKIGTKKQFILKSGQFIVSKIDARYGAFGIAPNEVNNAIITGNFWAFDVDFTKVNIEWFNQFTNSKDFYDLCERASSGITHRKYLDESFFLNYEILLPSVDEQLNQMYEIKNLYTHIQAITTEQEIQLTHLKQLRQQILSDAMQGKLDVPHVVGESGADLLARIRAEKTKNVKKENPLPEIKADDIPFAIPAHWVWCRIDSLVHSLKNDLRTGPFGSALHKSEHKLNGTPVWGIESISKDGKFTNKNKIFVCDEKAKSLKSFEVKGGDLIISRSGTVGELCVLPKDIQYGLISSNLMKISLNQSVLLPEFFCYVMKSGGYIDNLLAELCSGSTRLFITQKILCQLIFPLPPLSEQTAIVRKIESLMVHCDELEASIRQNQEYTQMLYQTALREALQQPAK